MSSSRISRGRHESRGSFPSRSLTSNFGNLWDVEGEQLARFPLRGPAVFDLLTQPLFLSQHQHLRETEPALAAAAFLYFGPFRVLRCRSFSSSSLSPIAAFLYYFLLLSGPGSCHGDLNHPRPLRVTAPSPIYTKLQTQSKCSAKTTQCRNVCNTSHRN